ncbi:MAG TPA: carboxypeptidase-like regulatory domain-containing protein [Candidatus Acidoferrales bacterium]|nr:carboxypeptidase-like regulatory domain-containing protein [Candidatus Acidoferrales bacterium]
MRAWKYGSRFWGMNAQRVLMVLLFVGCPAVHVWAQGEADISGIITDAEGGAIPGATVKVESAETGSARNLTTDEAGRYDAPLLPIGNYAVTAEKTGFQPESKTGITLTVGQRATVDVVLPLGELHQTIQVTDRPDVVAISTEDTSGLVGQQQVKDLPLNGRSYDQLLVLNPGIVNYTSQKSGGIGTSNSVIGNMFAVSGRRPQENLYLLNGVEYTGASEINVTPGGASGLLLGVDAVREFAVVADTYGAEYGKRPGAQVNIVTASGTNQVHGNAYEFLRNSALDARNYFDQGEVPPFQRNEFGGSLGGPLRKDKIFLFGNYEGFRENFSLSDVTFVPDAQARSGYLPCSGLATVPADCSAATAPANVGLAPSVAPLLALWPEPATEVLTSTGLPTGIAKSFSNPLQYIREDFGTARLDQVFSNSDTLSGVYTIDDSFANTPTTNPLSLDIVTLREQVVSVSETHIFSPTLVNKATFGFSRGAFYFDGYVPPSLAGTPGFVPGKPVGAVIVGGGTTLNGASQITAAGTNAGSDLRVARNIFTYENTINWTRGIHQVSAGVWFEQIQSNDDLAQGQNAQASFSTLQGFLQGNVSTFTVAPASTPLNWRSLEGAWYVEDVIKPSPKLEIRLGFRDEFTNGWNEAHGRASNYLFAGGAIATNPRIADSVFTTNYAKFLPAPRVSIAWAPFSKKTVFRAGFGTYYALLDALSYRLDQNPPYNTVFAIKGSSLENDEAALAGYVPGSPLPSGAKISPSGVSPELKTPTVEAYTFKIEREISSTTSLSVGYVGSHGYHELLSIDSNTPIPTICPTSCPAGYPAGIYYNASSSLANPAVTNSTTWFSYGTSLYNGLEVDVLQRLSHGVQFRGVYTFSKGLDDGDNMNTSIATNSPAFTANPNDIKADWGRASFDIRHAAVINATYDLPFARAAAAHRPLNAAFGNWQISGIETLQSGLPFTPQLGYNPSNDGDSRNPVRPSINPGFAGSIIEGGPSQYFNPNAFKPPLAGTYGNVSRNSLRGPGLVETDLSLAKNIPFSERVKLQFKAEFFNLFNHTNFNTPNTVVFTSATAGPSPTAGQITSTATTSRQIQLGLKLLW